MCGRLHQWIKCVACFRLVQAYHAARDAESPDQVKKKWWVGLHRWC